MVVAVFMSSNEGEVDGRPSESEIPTSPETGCVFPVPKTLMLRARCLCTVYAPCPKCVLFDIGFRLTHWMGGMCFLPPSANPHNRICDHNMHIISGAVLCDGRPVIGCSLLPKSRQESTKKSPSRISYNDPPVIRTLAHFGDV